MGRGYEGGDDGGHVDDDDDGGGGDADGLRPEPQEPVGQ